MKTTFSILFAAAGLAAFPVCVRAADDASPKEDRKTLRALTPERERRGMLPRDGDRKVEKETVAFLGVETAPVSIAMSSQLGLPRGTGLVVNHVVARSPAASVLHEHDILLKLDDQILIETRQLSVLIRNHKEGDEVTLTYLRGGQKATATVKLGKTEVPKYATLMEGKMLTIGSLPPGGPFEFAGSPAPEGERKTVERVLSLIQDAPNGDPVRIQMGHHTDTGFSATALHTANSSLVFSDDQGSLELTMKDGIKNLVAKNAKGEPLFSGPVNTPDERKAMPPAVRERLEKLEGMHDITFRTDRDFQGTETKVIRPRGIVLPKSGDFLRSTPIIF